MSGSARVEIPSRFKPQVPRADDIWGACKHADDILPHLLPGFFTKSVFLQGHCEPGSIRIVKLGPAAPHAAEVKERMDTFDDPTKTLGYTVLEGDRLRQSLSRQHGAFQSLEDQNNDLLDVFRRTQVSDGFACKHADELLPKAMPEFFTSSTFLQGHGEPGSIRVVKMGPAIPHAGEVTERMDLFDEASKTLGYTVLQGDIPGTTTSAPP
ncbi:unnamed protein product [Sphagnum troendelagicum]|uniref:Uncharacterized protein n=1 Tax=Sphagnum troendelagicum TaxID=128251 RepID=A0ABP0TST9_9BRYO